MLNESANTDTLPAAQSSDVDDRPSTEEPTYTAEQYRKIENERESAIGRQKKAEGQVSALQSQLDEALSRLDQLEGAGVDPSTPQDVKDIILKQKNELRNIKKELAQAKIDSERLKELEEKESRNSQLSIARKIADGYTNIDAEDLLGKSEADMKAFCKKYGTPKEGEKPVGTVDSGKSSGGGSTDNLSPAEKIDAGLKKKIK